MVGCVWACVYVCKIFLAVVCLLIGILAIKIYVVKTFSFSKGSDIF